MCWGDIDTDLMHNLLEISDLAFCAEAILIQIQYHMSVGNQRWQYVAMTAETTGCYINDNDA